MDLRSLINAPKGRICCPEHSDNTPSLRLFESNGYCFQCGKYFTADEVLKIVGKEGEAGSVTPQAITPTPTEDFPAALHHALRSLDWRFKHELARDVGIIPTLQERGYTVELASRMGLGAIRSRTWLDQTLTLPRFQIPEMELVPLSTYRGLGRSYKLCIPVHDTHGLLIGWKWRRTNPASDGPKYLCSLTSSLLKRYKVEQGFFNIHRTNLRGKGNRCIFVMEGELDALHATALGIKACVASSTAIPHKGMIADAVKRGVREVVFIHDNDKPGEDSIEPARKLIEDAGISFFTVDWTGLMAEDVDNLLVQQGIAGFTALVNPALRLTSYGRAEHRRLLDV